MNLLSKLGNEDGWKSPRMTFPEQNILPFVSSESKKLLLSWDG